MTDKTKLNRRDAIKLLGAAAGASVLANIPSKWSKPELTSGTLPAHAQTSLTLQCDPEIFSSITAAVQSTVTIIPPLDNIVMRWNVTLNNASFEVPSPITGVALTVAGVAQYISGPVLFNAPTSTGIVRWSFENTSDGNGFCYQVNHAPSSIFH